MLVYFCLLSLLVFIYVCLAFHRIYLLKQKVSNGVNSVHLCFIYLFFFLLFPSSFYLCHSIHFSNLIAGPSFSKQVSSGLRCAIPPQRCIKSPYRSLDGSCNNLHNPIWGSANTRFGLIRI